MSLRVAVQMDPLENINIAGDSSFALMLSAQARGFEVWGGVCINMGFPGTTTTDRFGLPIFSSLLQRRDLCNLLIRTTV